MQLHKKKHGREILKPYEFWYMPHNKSASDCFTYSSVHLIIVCCIHILCKFSPIQGTSGCWSERSLTCHILTWPPFISLRSYPKEAWLSNARCLPKEQPLTTFDAVTGSRIEPGIPACEESIKPLGYWFIYHFPVSPKFSYLKLRSSKLFINFTLINQ